MESNNQLVNWEINTKMYNKNSILEINAENTEEFKYFKDSFKINKLNLLKYFANEKDIIKIKNEINTLINQKKFSTKYDEKLGILKLIFKPTSNENDNFEILLYENKNELINNMFTQINTLINDYSSKSNISSKEISHNENEPSLSMSTMKLKESANIKVMNQPVPEKVNITFLSVFPSGNTIIGCWDGKLKIYKTFDLKKKSSEHKAHNSCVMYIAIKNDNEFASCSDIEIKIFNIKKEGNEFIFENKLYIDNAHNDVINKILYSENNILFSCSMDGYIKIWNLNNNDENKVINENDNIFCFDYINEDKILISSGVYGTNIYDITINYNNNRLILNTEIKLKFKEAVCYSRFGMTKMYDDKFIVCGNYINIISLNEKKIIFTQKLNFTIWDSCYIKDEKELFFIGNSNNIVILIQTNPLENKYEELMKINEFKNKNYFRIVNMGHGYYFIFSACDDLFKFDYSDSVEDIDSMML